MEIGTITLELTTKNDFKATVKSDDKRINGIEGTSRYSLANAVEDLVVEIEEVLGQWTY